MNRSLLCGCTAAIAFTLLAAEPSSDAASWMKHLQFLASDEMRGRDTGSPEHRRAAEYVAAEMKRLGLEPAGVNGYLQPVPFRSRVIQEEQSRLSLSADGATTPIKLGEQANLGTQGKSDQLVSAGAVFVGYGLRIPELGIDDFKGLDLRGRIAVFLTGAPRNVPGALAAHSQSRAERAKVLREVGAIGMATIGNPRASDAPWARSTLARFMPSMFLDDPALHPESDIQLGMRINPEQGEAFFAGSPSTLAEILKADAEGKPLPHFPLLGTVRGNVVFTEKTIMSENVVGILRGSDPKLKEEYVALSAHLDHVGVGKPINGDAIFNGAMDNASGIAAILEIARVMASGPRPRRSILFVAVTGEEKGLLGSRYFAQKPTVPISSIVADVNLDMFLPIIPLKSIMVFGLEESTLGEMFRNAGRAAGIAVVADREPVRNIFIRSDQYNFVLRGVPALMFSFDAEPGTPDDKVLKDWLKQRYHAPSDDLNQPINQESAARFVRLLGDFAATVANTPERPRWKPDSFFRRFATNPN